MGNHHAEDDLEHAERETQRAIKERDEAWHKLPAEIRLQHLENCLDVINEQAVAIRDQIGFGAVFAHLRSDLQSIVEASRDYRGKL
jgi:hypothetical protein